MNPQTRYRVLNFDAVGGVDGRPQTAQVSIHDQLENIVIILDGDISSFLQLRKRKRKVEMVPRTVPTQNQIELDDSSFVDEFAPDPSFAGKPLR